MAEIKGQGAERLGQVFAVFASALCSAYTSYVTIRCPECGQIIGKEEPNGRFVDDCPACNVIFAGEMVDGRIDLLKRMGPRKGGGEGAHTRA